MKNIIIAGILGGLLMVSGLVKAEKIIFSQYDGVNTWNNVFVDTDNAKGFADANPGVAFVEAQGMQETKAQAGQSAQIGFVSVLHTDNRTWNYTRVGENNWSLNILEAANITGSVGFVDDQVRTTAGQGTVLEYREHREEIKEVKANREEPQEAKAIVVVPVDADMETFINKMINK